MKIYRRPWIAFFSHTGGEIKDICNVLKECPEVICSNNPNSMHMGVYAKNNHSITQSKWLSEDYRKIFKEVTELYNGIKPVITLHGWMKIVPPDICNEYEIYNGHPALINEYPELKGKDMQLAVINELEKYPFIGSVIHKCVPEVDSGEILEVEKMHNFRVVDKNLIFQALKNTSLQTWLRFLPTKLYTSDEGTIIK